MENDVLKNKIAPWQKEGRWYHGVYDYKTSDFVTDKTDKFIVDNYEVAKIVPNIFIRPKSTQSLKYYTNRLMQNLKYPVLQRALNHC